MDYSERVASIEEAGTELTDGFVRSSFDDLPSEDVVR
jgi:hypothetical protein